MKDAMLLAELLKDPSGLGYAAHIEGGSNSELARLVNFTDGKTPSRAVTVDADPDAVVGWEQIAHVLRGEREDLAIAAYLRGEWPAAAVPIPQDKADAAGLTDAHVFAAKILTEGTALGVDEKHHDDAFAIIEKLDPKALAIRSTYQDEKDAVYRAVVDEIAERRIARQNEIAARDQLEADVNEAVAAKAVT